MDSKSVIFIVVGSLLVMAIVSSITNFVSAEINCYSSGDKYICIFTSDDPPAKAITFCNSDGTNCHTTWLDKVSVVIPEVKNAIQNAIKNAPILQEDTQTNTNDSKELGGMKTDKGITKSPIE